MIKKARNKIILEILKKIVENKQNGFVLFLLRIKKQEILDTLSRKIYLHFTTFFFIFLYRGTLVVYLAIYLRFVKYIHTMVHYPLAGITQNEKMYETTYYHRYVSDHLFFMIH